MVHNQQPSAPSHPELYNAPLGKKSAYVDHYDPSLLFPIPRKLKRDEIGIQALPFRGFDLWTAFELSWLNPKGLPRVAVAEFKFPAEAPFLIESKSFKLYLNSFNNSFFDTVKQVSDKMETDLSAAAGAPVQVEIFELGKLDPERLSISRFNGVCLDHLDIECGQYTPSPHYLVTHPLHEVTETLYTHLLKSNCLVTGQPDWGSVQIRYRGNQIDHEGLLKYIVSFRNHNEFHEQCVERIFVDISRYCTPKELSVYARYTRRGGLDINPYRISGSWGDVDNGVENIRLLRQ